MSISSAMRLALDRGLQLGRHVAAKHEHHGGGHRIGDRRTQDRASSVTESVEMTAELAPHQLERLVQQHAALARVDAGRRRFEGVRLEPHFAVGVKAALGLQRERLDAAGDGAADVHRDALRVVERLELRLVQLDAASGAGRSARYEFLAIRQVREQRTRRAMRIAFESRPGTDQLAGAGTPRGERRRARRESAPAALAAGTPAATCRRSGMKTSGRGGGGHCAASRPATQMPS